MNSKIKKQKHKDKHKKFEKEHKDKSKKDLLLVNPPVNMLDRLIYVYYLTERLRGN